MFFFSFWREAMHQVTCWRDRLRAWWSLWIRWASRYASAALPADADEAPSCLEDVISAFSSRYRLVDAINAAKGGER